MAFIPKEVPLGATDSVNKTFVLATIIDEIDDVFVDGEIYLGEIDVAFPNTIMLADAPTTSIFVDYFNTPTSNPALSNNPTKETPSGAVDGANKTFVLSQSIFEIDDVFVDGAIYLGGISIGFPFTIVLDDAPTTSITVDYFTSPPPAPGLMDHIPKETPSGVVDGVNKQFTTSTIIKAIDDIWIDGAVYEGNISVLPPFTIILDDAPTVSIEIDYWNGPNPPAAPKSGGLIQLQKPKIIDLQGYNIRIQHPDLSLESSTGLVRPVFANAGALKVLDNSNFSDGDYFIVGQIGDAKTEEGRVDGAVLSGQDLQITTTLSFDHEQDAPVTKIVERGIRIYGTNGGAGVLLSSINSITSPIPKAVPIQWSKPFTEYRIAITDTTYLYYYATFYDGILESTPSDLIPATGYGSDTVSSMIKASLSATDTLIDNNQFTWEMMVGWLQLWQDSVSQFSYQDPTTGRWVKKDWPFEIANTKDYPPILMVQNEDQYDLSSLNLKYKDSNRAIVNIQIDNQWVLTYKPVAEFRAMFLNKHRTQVSTLANPGDTVLNVDNAASFQDTGSLNIGNQIITYTGKTLTTFTGIPSSGVGSITAIISPEAAVWQNLQQGVPSSYTIIRDRLYLNLPPDAQTAGKPLQMDFYKQIPQLQESSDSTLITFTNTSELFLNSKIEQRKGNMDKAGDYMAQFKAQMVIEAQNDEIPAPQSYSYYDYENPWTDYRDRINIAQ